MDDWQLLQKFVAERNEQAFETLVHRHGALVQSVAIRQVQRADLAQDVAQAVFILLARRAASLRRGTILSGWLFHTTRFVALRALRGEARRQRREQEAHAMQEHTRADTLWKRIAPAVDDVLAQLKASDRDALLLRFFEGCSFREVGDRTGVTEEAAKKRVARALEKVREELRREGLSIPVAALGAAMAEQANAAARTELLTELTRVSLSRTSIPAPAAKLADEAIAAVYRSQWLSVSVTALLTVAIGWSAYLGLHRGESAGQERSRLLARAVPFAAENDSAPEATAAKPGAETKTIRFRAVDANTGQGIPSARVVYAVWVPQQIEDNLTSETDADGGCDIRYPSATLRLDIGILQNGYVARFATWPSEGNSTIPPEYTLRLDRVTQPMSGQVNDPQGKPLPNATIRLQAGGTGDSAHRESPRERFGFLRDVQVATTDADGRWSFQLIPPQHPGFMLEARHRDFADTQIVSAPAQPGSAEADPKEVESLRTGSLVTTMQPAYTLTGQVVDDAGRPLADATIQENEDSPRLATDDAGTFSVPKLKAGPHSFTVAANGCAPERLTVDIGSSTPPVTIALQKGAVLRVRVVDRQGAPVPDAVVGLEPRGEFRNALHWRARTDPEGRVEWTSAPRDSDLELFSHREGFAYARDVKVRADGEEHEIRLSRALRVQGRVFDGDRGRGVPDFRAIPGYGGYEDREERWFAGSTVRGTNGVFELVFEETRGPLQVRIVADGYEDWISEPLTSEATVALDIALRRASPEAAVRGLLLNPDDTPAVGAHVALLSFEHNVSLSTNRLFEGNKRWLTTTDSKGSFRFPVNRLAHSVAAVSPFGYTHLRVTDPGKPLKLRLEPFGRVEVRINIAESELRVESLYLYDPAADNYGGRVSLLSRYVAKPGPEGRFVFEGVPPGDFCVFINSGLGIPFHHQTPVTVRPNETTQVILVDRAGTRVSGRFVPPDGHAIVYRSDRFIGQIYAEPWKAPLAEVPKNERPLRELEFWTSPEGRRHVNTRRVHSIHLRSDGSFITIEPLPPGTYRFIAVVEGPPQRFSTSRVIEVPSESPTGLDLGEVPIQ